MSYLDSWQGEGFLYIGARINIGMEDLHRPFLLEESDDMLHLFIRAFV